MGSLFWGNLKDKGGNLKNRTGGGSSPNNQLSRSTCLSKTKEPQNEDLHLIYI